MLLAALFDREINCRRAASAAFQENVGRQGNENFKHGIEILTAADYFTLGNRVNAYTSIAKFVANFDKYKHPIIDHLRTIKLFHWDVEIRELTSQSLGNLVSLDPDYFTNTVLDDLFELVCDVDLLTRHGAVLGIAEIVLAVASTPGKAALVKKTEQVVDVVLRIEKARLYRGKGGEIMRSAVCRLIECMSAAKLPLSVKHSVTLLDSLDDCIKHPQEQISIAAVSGMRELTRFYFPVSSTGPSPRLHARVAEKYAKIVKTEDNAAATRGFSLALGALPPKLLAFSKDSLSAVVRTLCEVAETSFQVGDLEPDAETRRNCVVALAEVVDTVGVGTFKAERVDTTDGKGLTPVGLDRELCELVFATLFASLEDYSMDKRGDVGSWVRCAALTGLRTLTLNSVKASDGIVWDYNNDNGKKAEQQEEGETEIVPSMDDRMKMLEKDIEAKVGASLSQGEPMRESFKKIPEAPYFDAETCKMVLGAILKQLSEKLDNVRDLAGGLLMELLSEEGEVRLPFVLDRGFLVGALAASKASKGGVNWASPTTTFPMMVKAMNIDAYHAPIVEGLCVSVGGLTESVVKSSSAALLDWVRTMKKLRGDKHMLRLGRTLLKLMVTYEKNERVVVPVLRTIHLLAKNDCVGGQRTEALSKEGVAEDQFMNDFDSRLFKLLQAETDKSKSYKKLVAIIDCLTDFLGASARGAEGGAGGGEEKEKEEGEEFDVSKKALKFLMLLLAHPFPKIRKYVADQLYIALLSNDEIVEKDEEVDNASDMLLNTAWDGEIEGPEEGMQGVRERRNELAEKMGVALSEKAKARKKKKGGKEKVEEDEHESYMSLVNTAGF